MSIKNNDAENELEDFLPIQPKAEAPAGREFKSWHKPRKQFIRRKQWQAAIGDLIKQIHFPPDNRVFRYLTLPSEDMLDVRVLESGLQRSNLKLKYLGFFSTRQGSPDDTRMNLSESEIKGLDRIDETSEVVRDRLETTGNRKSMAFRKLVEHAPYHAVNVDLCGHFAAPRRGEAVTYIDAIHSIASVQVEKSTQCWLLFLTTRFQPDNFDAEHLKGFIVAIKENVEKSALFANRLSEVFMREGDDLIDFIESSRKMSRDEFRSFFCIGFAKWLLAFLTSAEPKTAVEMLPGYYYTVQEPDQDMLSLAFKCSPRPRGPQDRFHIASSGGARTDGPVDEVALAIEIARATQSLTNLDDLLSRDSIIWEKMVQDSMRFLKEASYDVAEYRSFAGDGVQAQVQA